MGCFRRARVKCLACGRDVSRDVPSARAQSARVRCTCGADLDIPLDQTWWISFRVAGKVKRRRIGPDRKLAAQAERRVLTDIARGVWVDPQEDPTIRLPALADLYFSAVTRRRPGYLEAERRLLAGLCAHLGDVKACDVDTVRLEAWVAAERARGQKPGSIARRISIFSSMMTWAVKHKHLRVRPVMPSVPVSNARNAWMTKDDAVRLLAAIQDDDTRDAIELLLATGLRRRELTTMRWEWVNMAGEVLTLPAEETKSGRARTLPLNTTALGVLRRRLAAAVQGAPVFHRHGRPFSEAGLSQAFKKAVRKMGLHGLTLHSCRHTCASWLVQAGTDLWTTAALLGHSSLGMVARYSHLSPDGLKKAMASAEVVAPAPPPAPQQDDPRGQEAAQEAPLEPEPVRQVETKMIPLRQKVA